MYVFNVIIAYSDITFTAAYNSHYCLYFVAFGAIYILIYSSEIFSYSICSDTVINTQTVLC